MPSASASALNRLFVPDGMSRTRSYGIGEALALQLYLCSSALREVSAASTAGPLGSSGNDGWPAGMVK